MMKKSFVFFIESNLAAYNYTNMDNFLFLNKINIESLFRLHFVCNAYTTRVACDQKDGIVRLITNASSTRLVMCETEQINKWVLIRQGLAYKTQIA